MIKKSVNRPYEQKELDAIRALREKLDQVINEVPGNEGRREELLRSLIAEMDKLPEETRKRNLAFSGVRNDLMTAVQHKLSADEKKLLSDPSSLTGDSRDPLSQGIYGG